MRISCAFRLAFTRANKPKLFSKNFSHGIAPVDHLLAVLVRPNSTLIGYCGFLHWHLDGVDEIEIGYRLHPDYWNKGLMTKAARAVRDHAFRDLKLPRVISLIHPENIPSRRVAEKIGMILEKQITFRGFPTNVFSLSHAQWAKGSAA
jgi:RimJ/RimL family protein N-acetyltransferase